MSHALSCVLQDLQVATGPAGDVGEGVVALLPRETRKTPRENRYVLVMRRSVVVVLGIVIIAFGFAGSVMLVAFSGTYLLVPALLLLVAAAAGLILSQLLKTDSSSWPHS